MQIFEPWMVQKYKPMRNFVLCKTLLRADVIKIGQLELYVDTSYNQYDYAPIVQQVVAIPKQLYFGRETRFATIERQFDPSIGHARMDTVATRPPIPVSMPWKVPMELRTSDTVFVDALSLINAEKQNRAIMCGDARYTLIPYEDIYFKLVNGVAEMLQGWILCEPTDDQESEELKSLKQAGFEFPGVTVTNDNKKELGVKDKLGIVRALGMPVEEYLDDIDVTDEVSTGDIVVFKWDHNRRLETGACRFYGDKPLIVTRRERIVAKVSDELF